MKPARSQTPLIYPSTWQEFACGEWASGQIQTHLEEWLPKFFGYHFLKLGGLSCELDTQNSRIQHQVSIDLFNTQRNVTADLYELPFVDKAFDACLLANQFDYCQDPHRLLREIDRVIIDDGYLIISGVNPSSLMGFGRFFPGYKHRLPWSGRLFSPYRIKDWLGVLNYELIEFSCFGLIPVTKQRAIPVWLEHQLADFAPVFGSLYFLVARKRTYPLNPIKKRWALKKSFAPVGVNYRVGTPD